MERERKAKEGNRKRVQEYRERNRSNGGSNGSVTGDISSSLSSSPLSVTDKSVTSSPGGPGEDAIVKYRKKLKSEKAELQAKLAGNVISPLREELSEQSWESWIKPLLVADLSENVLTLWVDSSGAATWIRDHYLEKITEKLQVKNPGMKVRITSEIMSDE